MSSFLVLIFTIQISTIFVCALEITNDELENKHGIESVEKNHITEVLNGIEFEKQANDYEIEKQQYYDMLRRKLGLNSQQSNEKFLFQKRKYNKVENTENKRNQYYTRPCLLNAISCYFYG